MNRQLIIHAGCHKTGTSALQKALSLNEQLLNDNNIFILKIGKRRDNHSITKPIVENKFTQEGSVVRLSSLKKIVNLAKEIKQSQRITAASSENGLERYIFSAESLSWLFRVDEIKKINDSLSGHFDSIKAIFYVRRQDKMIRSHHKQGAFTRPANIFYGNSLHPDIASPDHFYSYLDVSQRIALWSQVLGRDNICVRVMSKEELVQNDITIDFFSALNLKHIAETIDITECRSELP